MAGSPALIVRVAANLEELKKNLADGTATINTTTAAMGKLSASFSGDRLIQNAQNVVAAVHQIGGATRLTEAEHARVNLVLEKALEKYRVLGREAPMAMRQLAYATKVAGIETAAAARGAATAGETWSSWLGKANGLLAAFGLGVSVSALVSFGKGLIDSAGALADLSAKTGASVEMLQRWAFVGKQAGVSTDQFNDALFKLGARLSGGAGGGKGVREAVEDLGLSWEKLKASTPDQQFNTVVQALENMTDAGDRNRLGLEIFGKSFAGIAPAVAKGYTEMAASATVSSAAQIKAIDEATDRWDRFVANQKAALTSHGGELVQLTDKLGIFGTALALASGMRYTDLIASMRELATTQEFIGPLQAKQAEGVKNYTIELVKAMIEVDRMTASEIAAVEHGQRLGKTVDEITDEYGISAEALKVLTERTKEHEKATEKAAAATKKAKEIEAAALLTTTKLWDEYFALQVTHGGTANEIAIANIKRWEADAIASAIKAGTATKDFYEALATLSKEKTDAVGVDWNFLRTRSIESLQEMAANARATYNEMIFGSQHFSREVLAEQLAKTRELEAEARNMGRGYVDAFKAAAAEAADLLKVQQELRAEERKRQLESRQLGGAFNVTSQNFDQTLTEMITSGGWNPTGRGSTMDVAEAHRLARLGYAFDEITAIFARRQAGGTGPIPPPQGPRIPGFAGGVQNSVGEWAMVGERGPEMMHVPRGANIYPHGTGPSGGGMTVVNHIYVTHPLATPREIYDAVDSSVMRVMRSIGTRF